MKRKSNAYLEFPKLRMLHFLVPWWFNRCYSNRTLTTKTRRHEGTKKNKKTSVWLFFVSSCLRGSNPFFNDTGSNHQDIKAPKTAALTDVFKGNPGTVWEPFWKRLERALALP